MKTNEFIAPKTISGKGAKRAARGTDSWQIARDRLLLHLQCLNFPAQTALDLALKALKEAEQKLIQGSENSPVLEAMQALDRFLIEQNPGFAARGHFLNSWCELPVSSTPPIHRMPMVPEEIISVRLLALLKALLGHLRISPPRKRKAHTVLGSQGSRSQKALSHAEELRDDAKVSR